MKLASRKLFDRSLTGISVMAVILMALSLLVLLGVGWGFMVIANTSNALVQTQVPDHMRGRVMGIYTLTFFGLMPIGSLIAGAAADWIGEPLTVVAGGVILLMIALLVWAWVPDLRQSA